ncbi:unnamed protein product [Ostreobium quekettii]|uniref:Uncharacterized protein n=1 Tax=Ostreobium quekettii TaxID=121088 RepID=A0A8S1IJQ1_9CHLO|nr:unnamed protein product [Ostreobium quekettii]
MAFAAQAALADAYSLTIVTDKGVSITAPQEWGRRLAQAGIDNVRIRGGRAGDQADIEETPLSSGTLYRITGVLTSGGKLTLPGESFTIGQTAKLRDYLDRVLADGGQAITAQRGQYGLTKEQFEHAFTELGRPIPISTKGQPLRAIVDKLSSDTGLVVAVDPLVSATFARLECRDELQSLSYGCGLAIALKAEGLALAPEKPRGEPVRVVVRLASDLKERWPIGWPTKARGTELAPKMFEKINVEIDGFSLQEAVDAIGPRIEMPVLWDHAAMDAKRIDPAAVQVKLPPASMAYHRILSRLLFQARLRGEVRVDESGTIFYWIYSPMADTQLIPQQWALPEAIRNRLGDEVGRQRAMVHDGHLLLVLHAPPAPDQDAREGRFFWRAPTGEWRPQALHHGETAIGELIDEYDKLLDRIDADEDVAQSAAAYFDLLTLLNPLVRASHNLHQTLQQAREELPDVRQLILLRDRAYGTARRAELLQADARNTLDFVIARRAEEQADSSRRQARAAHRLNVLAALTFPLLTLCAVFGANLEHGLEQWDAAATAPTPMLAVVGAGLLLGAVLVGYVTRK